MSVEDVVKDKIISEGYTLKSFAEKIEIPYTTLITMLQKGFGRSSVDNVIKVADGLGVSIDEIAREYDYAMYLQSFYDWESKVEEAKNKGVNIEAYPGRNRILAYLDDEDIHEEYTVEDFMEYFDLSDIYRVPKNNRIKQQRINLGLTLEDLSRELGISWGVLEDYENGEIGAIRKKRMEEIASVLNSTPEYLLNIPIKSDQYNSIPLIGTIAAGTPILAEENIERYFNLDSSIPADFCLKVKGESMIEEGILPGDIVFIRRQSTLENGEIGAVVISDGCSEAEATLKRFYKTDGQILLQPANKDYSPIVITSGDVWIAGKLVAVLNIRD